MLTLFLATTIHAYTIDEMLEAAAKHPGVETSLLEAREGGLQRKAADNALYPVIGAFGKAEVYNSPTNARPMPPTEVNVAAGESIPFSREMLRYGLTLNMPIFVKTLYDLRRKSEALAAKARLGHTLKLVSQEAAVIAANGAYQYLVNLDAAISSRLNSLVKTREDMANKVKNGRAAETELLKVENSINELEMQKNDLASKIMETRRQLETLTGLQVTEPADMVMGADLVPAPYLGEQLADKNLDAAREELKRRTSARYPALYLSGMLSGNEGEAYNTGDDFYRQYNFAALTLKIPLFDKELDTGRAIARIQVRKAEKELEDTRIELTALERSLQDKLPVVEKSHLLAGKSLDNNRRLLQVAKVAHEAGRTTTEEYLRYESQVLASQASLYKTETEKWQIISQLAVLYGKELRGIIQ